MASMTLREMRAFLLHAWAENIVVTDPTFVRIKEWEEI
jgi:hypothetical protein